ncbi:MAG TPA: SDR family NAD(P)-dependent oxidoreductase [Kofleriaceae bacterium]|nr:SDR family NAD(P)-dependent oxidoreductase [Kofleriaceae bacterium]
MVSARTFSLQDQLEFAQISGDWNPLHVDSVVARRTIFGAPIVHGVHQVLWALEQYCKGAGPLPRRLTELRVNFAKPLYLDELVTLQVETDALHQSTRLQVMNPSGTTADIFARFEDSVATPGVEPARYRWAERIAPHELTVAQGAVATGALELLFDSAHATNLFPALCAQLSACTVAELLATTRLVGMIAPGLHSLFAGLHLQATAAASPAMPATVSYRPGKTSEKYSILEYIVQGPTLQGDVKAFYRPPPVEVRVATRDDVMANEFADVRALIVGGSRGLGAAFARSICAGGGHATVTYHRGVGEAGALVQDIISRGGDAVAVQYDVTANQALPSEMAQAFTHLIYCATPVLLSTRKGAAFEPLHLRTMVDYFVVGMVQLVQALRGPSHALHTVISPSTIFLNSGQGGLAYGVAKAAMEEACRYLVRESVPPLRMFAPRLPKTATDQTASLVASTAADPIVVAVQCLRQSRTIEGQQGIGCALSS